MLAKFKGAKHEALKCLKCRRDLRGKTEKQYRLCWYHLPKEARAAENKRLKDLETKKAKPKTKKKYVDPEGGEESFKKYLDKHTEKINSFDVRFWLDKDEDRSVVENLRRAFVEADRFLKRSGLPEHLYRGVKVEAIPIQLTRKGEIDPESPSGTYGGDVGDKDYAKIRLYYNMLDNLYLKGMHGGSVDDPLSVIVHELGHQIYAEKLGGSVHRAVQRLYKSRSKKKDWWPTENAKANPKELFADVFAQMILGKDRSGDQEIAYKMDPKLRAEFRKMLFNEDVTNYVNDILTEWRNK